MRNYYEGYTRNMRALVGQLDNPESQRRLLELADWIDAIDKAEAYLADAIADSIADEEMSRKIDYAAIGAAQSVAAYDPIRLVKAESA